MPRSSTGKASVRIAVEFAINSVPPTPWMMRQPMSQSAPAAWVHGHRDSAIEAMVNTAKPALYMRTRSGSATHPPEEHDQDSGHDEVAHEHPQQVVDVVEWF